MDNFLSWNVVSLTLTRHNDDMKQTLTYRQTDIGSYITYANGELAWIRGEKISSSTSQSTAVDYWQYEVKQLTLVVKYKNTDTFYTYEGVPFTAVFALMSADSLGAFIAKEIKPHYSVGAL